MPDNAAIRPVFELRDVRKIYQVRDGAWRRRPLHAVDGVSLTVKPEEVLGIVGESGSGKTTLAKLMLGLTRPTSGEALLHGQAMETIDRRQVSRQVQFVFQDPYSSLNPSRSIEDAVAHPLRLHGIGNRQEQLKRAHELLDLVGLPKRTHAAFPGQLSGGQRQRVVIARALSLRPGALICDEPTSALDVSVQAQILNLLHDLRKELKLTYVFISHNLEVMEHIAQTIAVVYRGKIVEYGFKSEIFENPRDVYTRRLLASAMTVAPGAGIPKLEVLPETR
jgi:peptide/nickel transport system ATP-binding protein